MGTSIARRDLSTREPITRARTEDVTGTRPARTTKDKPATDVASSNAAATVTAAPRSMEQRRAALASARSGEDLARLHFLRNAPVTRAPASLAASTATAATAAQAAAPTYPPHVQKAIDLVRDGKTDDATRTAIGDHFAGLTVAESKEAMDAIRAEGLLDNYLNATLRDENGKPVDSRVFDAAKKMMETGRLDAYAETLARTSFNVYTPTPGGEDDPYFSPSKNGVYIPEGTAASANLHETLAHETFHAFADAHGSSHSAVDEGFGIAAIHYAYTNDQYSLAEAVYGTKNFYRDILNDPKFPIGDMSKADPKLRELLGDIAARDKSQYAWDDPEQAKWDYFKYWKDYSRSEDADKNGTPDWFGPGGYAEKAEAAMLAGRGTERSWWDNFTFSLWKLFN